LQLNKAAAPSASALVSYIALMGSVPAFDAEGSISIENNVPL
jgi:hypothetical protein